MKKYILDEKGEPICEPDLIKWARWFETADLHVKCETIGESRVSTVFLGLDHSFGQGEPLLWETMVFSKKPSLDQFQTRCAGSREQAKEMHERMVNKVKKSQGLTQSPDSLDRVICGKDRE